jgi:hypothetical protein
MPHKYWREIEEILSNMEQTEARRGGGEPKTHTSARPGIRARLRGPSMHLRLTPSESLLLAGVVLAVIAACVAFYVGPPANLVSGVVGLGAFAALVAGLIFGWRTASRPPYSPTWRTSNVVDMRPRRRGPLSEIVTRLRILRLKVRYWFTRNR